MYREYRDTTLTGAVNQMYSDMNGRHRVRERSIQIIRTGIVESKDCKRKQVMEFHKSDIKFPLAHRLQRAASKQNKQTFHAQRPNTFFG